jgi:tetratricopeptide (TPR) repeat protein
MACQALGILGFARFEAGQMDSMRSYYDQAYALALRHRLPEQVGRILSFYASYYQGEGRLALAHELYLSARELCRAYKGGQTELRFLDRLAEFHADLGSWRVVSNLLEQARLLLGQRRELSTLDYALLSSQTRMLQARLLMSRGAVDSAETLYREIDAAYSQVPYQQPRAWAQLQRCRGLLDNGHCEAALVVAEQGLRLTQEQHLPLREAQFQLLLAEGRLALDQPDLADQHLRSFAVLAGQRPEALHEEWMRHDVFELRRCLQGQAARTARIAALGTALSRLEICLGEMDPSVQSYLMLESCDRLRFLVHDILAGDPRRGYVFELTWRRLPARLGRRPSGAVSPAGVVSWWQGSATLAEVVDRWILRCGTTTALGDAEGDGLHGIMHLLYLVHGDDMLRWTRTAAGIRCEPVPVATRELERRVARSVGVLSREPAAPTESWLSGAADDLRELARLLLPPECRMPSRSGSAWPLLLISPDGCLAQFPFETLPVTGPDGHETPLLACMNVAYLRCVEPRQTAWAPGPAVVVARPALPVRLRGHPELGDLPISETEANLALAAFPGALLLEGAGATKEALTGLWEQAPVIYLAAHLVRDPEVPYVAFVPLAPTAESDSPADTYLDLTDIRRAHLDGCRLVVLSACASGAPYVEGTVMAPSLGDAFLDAGAAAVVQTFWHVEDQAAGRLMSRFLREVGFAGRHPVQALGAARRAFLAGDPAFRHPFYWASYALQLNNLDDLGQMMSAAGGMREN